MIQICAAQRARFSVPASGRLTIACALLGALSVAVTTSVVGLDSARLWSLLVLLVLSPAAEEAVFRAGLQEWLLRHRVLPAMAIGLTALVFGLVHVAARGNLAAVAVALPAIFFGLAYQRWRKLRYCALLHAGMNLLWLASSGASTVAWLRPWGP